MAGKPLKSLFPDGVCGAKNRRGEACRVRREVYRMKNGAHRCRWHGGLSTGPRTEGGKRRSLAALQAGNRRWRQGRKASV